MIRRQYIPYLFVFAFAMALAHNFLPHTHPKEIGKEDKHHHADGAKSHSHKKDGHHHSHPHEHNEELPVFTHFANGDITVTAKHSYNENQRVVLEYEEVVLVSFPLPAVFPGRPAPIPYARDWPLNFLLLTQSLRAPPQSPFLNYPKGHSAIG